MNEVAEFVKVSFDEFLKTCHDINLIETDETIFDIWDAIKLPTRATEYSAGYDFFMPYNAFIDGKPQLIPTGIRAKIAPGWFLMCCPKSGLGFKYEMRLANTIGIIDGDYFNSDNEGHIMAKISASKVFYLRGGDKFMQGIFLPFGVTINDNTTGIRNGGFGSTGN